MAKPLTLKAPENRKPGRTRRERPDGLLPGLYSRLAIYLPARVDLRRAMPAAMGHMDSPDLRQQV